MMHINATVLILLPLLASSAILQYSPYARGAATDHPQLGDVPVPFRKPQHELSKNAAASRFSKAVGLTRLSIAQARVSLCHTVRSRRS